MPEMNKINVMLPPLALRNKYLCKLSAGGAGAVVQYSTGIVFRRNLQ